MKRQKICNRAEQCKDEEFDRKAECRRNVPHICDDRCKLPVCDPHWARCKCISIEKGKEDK